MKRIIVLFAVCLALTNFIFRGIADAADPLVGGGQDYSLALLSDGTVWTWGNNTSGQLGVDGINISMRPVQVQALVDVDTVAAGNQHCLAVLQDGTVWAWGLNSSFQIGDGTTSARYSPTMALSGLDNVVAVAAGIHHSIALRIDNTIWSWGANDYGQLGLPLTTLQRGTPIPASEITAIGVSGSILGIVSGGEHNLALTSTVWGWGRNDRGQLGNDSTQLRHDEAVQVSGLTEVVMLVAGIKHNIALRADGTVWAWGGNTYGQLGIEGDNDQRTPIQVPGIQNAIAVAAGEFYTLALLADGSVWSWGRNSFGQLGDGSTYNRFSPQRIEGIDGVKAIAGGKNHALAIRNDDSVWSWGNNEFGQLGDGTIQASFVPTRVLGVRGAAFLNVSVDANDDPGDDDTDDTDDDADDGDGTDDGDDDGTDGNGDDDDADDSTDDGDDDADDEEEVDDDYISASSRGPRVEHNAGCFVGALFER